MNYFVHMTACAGLLASGITNGRSLSELEEIMLYMICFEEVGQLISTFIPEQSTYRSRLITP